METEGVYEYKGNRFKLACGTMQNGARKLLHIARYYDSWGHMVAQGTSDAGKNAAISWAKRRLLERFGSYANNGHALEQLSTDPRLRV